MALQVFSSAASARVFGLGFGCGLALACAGFVFHETRSTPLAGDSPDAPSATGVAAWHHPPASDDLATAVRLTSGLLSPALAPAAAAGPIGTSGGLPQMLAQAEQHRRQREFSRACALYAAVAAQGGMTADSWADYADAQASLAGRLAGAPEQAIDAALAIEPTHAKALWLKASLAHEQQRYADALVTWRRLLAVVPPGSSDARIIEANIAEATRLASG